VERARSTFEHQGSDEAERSHETHGLSSTRPDWRAAFDGWRELGEGMGDNLQSTLKRDVKK